DDLRQCAATDAPVESILCFELDGDLSFGAASALERHLAQIEGAIQNDTRVLVLSLQRARNPDAAFLGLVDKFHRRLQERRVTLILTGVRWDLARALSAS